MTAPETPAAEKKQAATEYVVLERIGSQYLPGADVDATSFEHDSWYERGKYQARSAEEAIRAHLHDAAVTVPTIEGKGKGGTFIAIPTRSWKPMTLNIETVTTLKLESA